MAPLISCQSISKSHGSRDLILDLTLHFSPGDHVGLIGPNGAGKSTLLNLIAKLDVPDSGEIIYSKEARVGYVPQHVEKHEGTIKEVLEDALQENTNISQLNREGHIHKVLGSVGIADSTQLASELSGGWARRLSIAKALVNEPNILLLDEPTNHLDLDTILWLENFLKKYCKTFIVTSHDRLFLEKVSNKVCELSYKYPKGVFTVEGNYSQFLKVREEFLNGQIQYEKGLRSKNVREQEWLKQSPKARSTKARARIEEAEQIKNELAAVKLRNTQKKAELAFNATDRQTKKLLVAKNLSKKFEGKQIFEKMDLSLMRGDRLGIVGGNGSGKSTLLKILSKEIDSDSGTIKYADDLEIFYFDQHRENLDLSLSLRDALSPNGDTILYRGNRIHVNSWCEKFLFDKSRLDFPIKLLSGGERARILIARLMMQPVDLLLLDEPTNDLDIETLELLEESLMDFPGAVVLISHDRSILDHVSHILLALKGDEGHCFYNDTETWLKNRKKDAAIKKPKNNEKKQIKVVQKSALSYKEKQELASMDQHIKSLEEEIVALSSQLEDPKIQNNSKAFQKACHDLTIKQKAMDHAYARWQELEDKS